VPAKSSLPYRAKDFIFVFLYLRAPAFVAGIFYSGTELMSRTNLSTRRKQKEVAN